MSCSLICQPAEMDFRCHPRGRCPQLYFSKSDGKCDVRTWPLQPADCSVESRQLTEVCQLGLAVTPPKAIRVGRNAQAVYSKISGTVHSRFGRQQRGQKLWSAREAQSLASGAALANVEALASVESAGQQTSQPLSMRT